MMGERNMVKIQTTENLTRENHRDAHTYPGELFEVREDGGRLPAARLLRPVRRLSCPIMEGSMSYHPNSLSRCSQL